MITGSVYNYELIKTLPGIRKGWFSNTGFTTGLKTLPTFRPDALVFFRVKKTRAFDRNVGKVFKPVVKLVLENQPFLMPEPAEKPSLHSYLESMNIIILFQQFFTHIL